MHYVSMGGAERALIGLLNALNTEIIDVDLFLNQHTGEFMPLIPKKINLLPERQGYNAIERPLLQVLKERQYGIVLGRLKARRLHRKYYRTLSDIEKTFDDTIFQYVAECVQPYLQSLDDLGEYDLAVSFLRPHNIVLNKVRAKKKVAWIHTDYSTIFVNAAMELPVWAGYDFIASISPDCTKSFLSIYPSLKPKIIEIENIISPVFVRQQADLFDVYATNEMPRTGFIFLSIGRYHHQKNFDNIPDIAKTIKEMGHNDFKWYIIGYGSEYEEGIIRQRIKDVGMEDYIILLGKRTNPYPYIKACDIYIQPSRYEGKSVAVREAQILCKPVIITNYPTAKSQVKNGIDGIIAPMDNEGCARVISNFLDDFSVLNSISSYLQMHDYGNENVVNNIYPLIEI